MSDEAADFYTGVVADAYALLKSTSFAPEPYARFVTTYGEPALELGCGDGDPLLDLVARGLDVDGVDSSGDMLARCRDRAAAAGLQVQVHEQRMETLALPRRYRSIYLAGPTFNLLPDDDLALRALEGIRAHLTDRGRALVPLWRPGPTPAAEIGVARETVGADGARLRYLPLAEQYDEDARTRTTTVRYEREVDGRTEVADREWVLHWHTSSGFGDLCRRAGLVVDAVADAAGDPVTLDADDADDYPDYVALTLRPRDRQGHTGQ